MGECVHDEQVFDRDPASGLLTQKAGTAGCITDDGKDDTGASTCAIGRVVKGTYPILVAPNGSALYSPAGTDHGFSVFHINGDGTLAQLSGANGCTTIDGKDNAGASTCSIGRAISRPYGGVVSPDGSTLYVSDDDTATVGGLGVFSLNPVTGVATQLAGLQGCITADGSSGVTPGQCTNGRALGFGYGMTIAPDGRSVYQATDASSNAGLAIYARETAPVCHAAAAATSFGRSVAVSLPCLDADGDAVSRSIVLGPAHGTLSAINASAGTATYTPAAGFSGTDGFTFAASDGVNSSAPVTATITVGPQPAVSGLRVSPSRFSLAGRNVNGRCVKPTKKNKRNKHCRRAVSLRISYTLNVADTVTLTVKRLDPGRLVKGRCVRPTKKNRKHHKCTRLINLRGQIVMSRNAGANLFTFHGRIGGHSLGPGTYQLIATPASGQPRKVTFKLMR
jgi:hypothetical protein